MIGSMLNSKENVEDLLVRNGDKEVNAIQVEVVGQPSLLEKEL